LDFLSELTKATIALFIIVDPFGNIPIFVGLTENMADNQRKKIFNVATMISLILLLAFAFLGNEILTFFGISIESFEVAGGILLLIVAMRILISDSKQQHVESSESIGAVPIAIPLLVGPGAITTTILNLQTFNTIVAIVAVVVVLVMTWVILRFINRIYRVLGKTGSLVIARVMALLIAAIAIQYILTGITNFTGLIH
jgi:multiple antibiotic resistance protein